MLSAAVSHTPAVLLPFNAPGFEMALAELKSSNRGA